ncbi:hypothetical protein CY0110_17227 [Crocosphaera chwakensis CCY0110]|uniref:Uncharacterized protein n=1 Tax=Crocosphaera chwakensis CCY0110 TaxID=391612 RepID=A3IIC7_9CHRO|nr:hypothetical protein CY0110_17227 [Crocosphaera chwakensis CCY0110]
MSLDLQQQKPNVNVSSHKLRDN